MVSSHSCDFTKSFCEAVWEFVAPDEGLECVAGVLEVGALSVADGFLALSPDAFDGVLVGAVGRQVDEMDPLQDVALPQVLPQFLRLVPSGVVPHHDDHLVRVLQGQIGQDLHDVGGKKSFGQNQILRKPFRNIQIMFSKNMRD